MTKFLLGLTLGYLFHDVIDNLDKVSEKAEKLRGTHDEPPTSASD